ncbi:Uncharacterised protein [Yersinia bercovieri]|nr:Uncharacterised protein [Yersinia bercovieri]
MSTYPLDYPLDSQAKGISSSRVSQRNVLNIKFED